MLACDSAAYDLQVLAPACAVDSDVVPAAVSHPVYLQV